MTRPSYKRHYVSVRCEVAADGSVKPVAVLWSEGITYVVNEVVSSTRTDDGPHPGWRYTVRIGTRVAHLYYDGSRWYVHPKQRVGA